MLRGKSTRGTCSKWVMCAIWCSVIISCLASSRAEAQCYQGSGVTGPDGAGVYTVHIVLYAGESCHVHWRHGGEASEFPAVTGDFTCGDVTIEPDITNGLPGFRFNASIFFPSSPCQAHFVVVSSDDGPNGPTHWTYDTYVTVHIRP
jgi:hypothetical protein